MPCLIDCGVLPQLLLSPCWIKKEETSPGCTCVERGGAVLSALDRIFRDLNRHEYDSIIRVLVTLPFRDLQEVSRCTPSLSLLASPRLILVIHRKILNYCYVPQQRSHTSWHGHESEIPFSASEDQGKIHFLRKVHFLATTEKIFCRKNTPKNYEIFLHR